MLNLKIIAGSELQKSVDIGIHIVGPIARTPPGTTDNPRRRHLLKRPTRERDHTVLYVHLNAVTKLPPELIIHSFHAAGESSRTQDF